MISIYKKELRQFFSSLIGYITIILFLLVNGLYLFVFSNSNILDFGYATLDAFFEFAPWVFIFLIPALAMRSLAEEFKAGTFETLQTRPVNNWQIVIAKYLSVLTIVLFAILPTLLYVVVIKKLSASGDIDTGGTIGSYIGLFFLAAVFAAISLCCSAFTQNTVIAFLISVFACVIIYFGCNAISSLPFFENGADYYMELFGLRYHYESISRGVIDSKDVIYFLSIVFFALFVTVKTLAKK
jgi:ABC-2 type transport system permease protein